MLFVEIKFRLTDGCERLNAIAQIIAEAGGSTPLPS